MVEKAKFVKLKLISGSVQNYQDQNKLFWTYRRTGHKFLSIQYINNHKKPFNFFGRNSNKNATRIPMEFLQKCQSQPPWLKLKSIHLISLVRILIRISRILPRIPTEFLQNCSCQKPWLKLETSHLASLVRILIRIPPEFQRNSCRIVNANNLG